MAIEALFGEAWFSDELADMGSKDAAMQLQGVWAIEVAELATMYRAESNRLKEWLTRRADRYRPPYGRNVVTAPRQCVLVGTVNPEGGYLKDPTGGRRFWPVRCEFVDTVGIERMRDHLWAEATAAYKAGEIWWLVGDELPNAKREQEARYESDPWEDKIAEGIAWKKTVSVSDIMTDVLYLQSHQQTHGAQIRVSKVLTTFGYRRVQRRDDDGKRQWLYELPDRAD